MTFRDELLFASFTSFAGVEKLLAEFGIVKTSTSGRNRVQGLAQQG